MLYRVRADCMPQSPPELVLPLISFQCVRDYMSIALEYNIRLNLFWRNSKSILLFRTACQLPIFRQDSGVEKPEAIKELRAKCDEIGRHITAMHPVVPDLKEPTTQGEILRALFELTKQVEVVKKHWRLPGDRMRAISGP